MFSDHCPFCSNLLVEERYRLTTDKDFFCYYCRLHIEYFSQYNDGLDLTIKFNHFYFKIYFHQLTAVKFIIYKYHYERLSPNHTDRLFYSEEYMTLDFTSLNSLEQQLHALLAFS